MPALQKQKEFAKKLIQSSVMLTDDKKKKWLARLDELSEAELKRLVKGLQKERGFLQGAIKGCVGTDKEKLNGLKQVFSKFTKKVQKFEEGKSRGEEKAYLSVLEKQLKEL